VSGKDPSNPLQEKNHWTRVPETFWWVELQWINNLSRGVRSGSSSSPKIIDKTPSCAKDIDTTSSYIDIASFSHDTHLFQALLFSYCLPFSKLRLGVFRAMISIFYMVLQSLKFSCATAMFLSWGYYNSPYSRNYQAKYISSQSSYVVLWEW